MSAYPTHEAAKAALLACGARLYQRGFVAANDGNLSIKVAPDQIWATPTGVSKGAMTADMLVLLDLEGNVLAGTHRPSSEIGMHLRIYREDPALGGVVHAHPPAATAFAAAGLPLARPVLQEAVVQLGCVPLAPFALPGTPAVAESVAPFCRTHRAVLLEYHGATAWGDTLEQALHRMECLEQYATVLLHLRTLGSERAIPPDLEAQLIGLRPRWGIR